MDSNTIIWLQKLNSASSCGLVDFCNRFIACGVVQCGVLPVRGSLAVVKLTVCLQSDFYVDAK